MAGLKYIKAFIYILTTVAITVFTTIWFMQQSSSGINTTWYLYGVSEPPNKENSPLTYESETSEKGETSYKRESFVKSDAPTKSEIPDENESSKNVSRKERESKKSETPYENESEESVALEKHESKKSETPKKSKESVAPEEQDLKKSETPNENESKERVAPEEHESKKSETPKESKESVAPEEYESNKSVASEEYDSNKRENLDQNETPDNDDTNKSETLGKSETPQNDSPPKSTSQEEKKKMNVLFIIADDLRPELGAYEDKSAPSPVHPTMYTPNLDALAQKSAVFHSAYVQFPLCGPSRASFLTSRRPDTLQQYSFSSFRATGGKNITTLPQYFKQNGYMSIGVGKIFDPPVDWGGNIHEERYSFSEPWYGGSNYHYWTHELLDHSWLAVSPETEKRRPLPDNQVLDHALSKLQNLTGQGQDKEQPFFLAVGFYKPHCPYIFPEKYLEHYPEDAVHLPRNPYVPSDFPQQAWHDYRNLRRFKDLHWFKAEYNQTLPNDLTLALRRAYYASVTYIDDLVGQLLDELEKQGLKDSTIVSFIGDHGYHLGENGEWTKQTTLELSARAPLMIHIPGLTEGHSDKMEFVEFVDIFPTLVEAAGLEPMVLCPHNGSVNVPLCTEGISFMPLLRGTADTWKDRTFTMQMRWNHQLMARSMRTSRHRYTEWKTMAPPYHVAATELYDHQADPWEDHNIAHEDNMKEVVKDLSKQMKGYWRAALPTGQMES